MLFICCSCTECDVATTNAEAAFCFIHACNNHPMATHCCAIYLHNGNKHLSFIFVDSPIMYHNMVSGLYLICGEGPFQSIRRHLSSSTSCSTTFQSGVATPLFDLPSADNGGSACTEARGTCHFTYEAEEELEERPSWTEA